MDFLTEIKNGFNSFFGLDSTLPNSTGYDFTALDAAYQSNIGSAADLTALEIPSSGLPVTASDLSLGTVFNKIIDLGKTILPAVLDSPTGKNASLNYAERINPDGTKTLVPITTGNTISSNMGLIVVIGAVGVALLFIMRK